MALGTTNPVIRSGRYRYVIAAMALAAHLAIGLNLFTVSPLLTLVIDDYGINRTTAGLLVSLPMLMAAAFGLPGGILLSRIGLRRAYFIGWASIAVLALSYVAPNFWVLIVLRLVFGVGLAFMITATAPMLMQWFRPKEVLVMNALTTAVLSLGIAISVAGAEPLAEVVNWRMSLTIFAGIGVAGTLAWTWAGRGVAGSLKRSNIVRLRDVGAVLRSRAIVLLLVADAGVLFQYTAFTGWLPTFYNEERGISLSRAGLVTSILPFVGVFAVLAGGIFPLRFGSSKVLFVGSGLLAGIGGLGAFLFPHLAGIYISVMVMGIGSWFYVPTLLTLPMQMAGMTPERVAVVWGSIMTFSGLSMFLAPILVGALRDSSGSFFPGFAICAAFSWSLLIAGLLLPRGPALSGTAAGAQTTPD
jgi:cyanate permease